MRQVQFPDSSHQTSSGTITPNRILKQTHVAMQTLAAAIKSSTEAKSYLYKKGWVLLSEEITLKTLTRTLFAVIVDNKIAPVLANPVLFVTYLITEKVKESTTFNITSAITKHILDAFVPITAEIQTRLEDHLQAVNASKKLQADCQEIGLVAVMFFFELLFLYFHSQFPSMLFLLLSLFRLLSVSYLEHARQGTSRNTVYLATGNSLSNFMT